MSHCSCSAKALNRQLPSESTFTIVLFCGWSRTVNCCNSDNDEDDDRDHKSESANADTIRHQHVEKYSTVLAMNHIIGATTLWDLWDASPTFEGVETNFIGR